MVTANLQLLPRLAALVEQLCERAEAKGIHVVIPRDGGVRSTDLQWSKFKQGRHQNAAGLWVPDFPDHRGVVTNAEPSKAPHCAHVDHDGSIGSAACDVAIVFNERIAWGPKDPGHQLYPVLGQLGEHLGLVWGGRWAHLADLDHFELPDFRSLTLAPKGPTP